MPIYEYTPTVLTDQRNAAAAPTPTVSSALDFSFSRTPPHDFVARIPCSLWELGGPASGEKGPREGPLPHQRPSMKIETQAASAGLHCQPPPAALERPASQLCVCPSAWVRTDGRCPASTMSFHSSMAKRSGGTIRRASTPPQSEQLGALAPMSLSCAWLLITLGSPQPSPEGRQVFRIWRPSRASTPPQSEQLGALAPMTPVMCVVAHHPSGLAAALRGFAPKPLGVALPARIDLVIAAPLGIHGTLLAPE